MNFDPQPFYPTHPLLKKYIAYYYFLRTENDFSTQYFAFPHTHTVLNLHLHATATITKDTTTLLGAENLPPLALVQGIRDFPLLANLKGALDKVTIIFKPLGINCFIDKDLSEVIQEPSQIFEEWNGLSGYQKLLKDFNEYHDDRARAVLLEDFLISIYQAKASIQPLEKAVQLLSDFEKEVSIEEIADFLHATSRTVNRLFHRHLGVSPVGFKKIARFRHSLENKIFASQFKRMTDLAYQSNFYDQAYFNKIYRKMTGANPQQFFKQIDHLADDQLIFHFQEIKYV